MKWFIALATALAVLAGVAPAQAWHYQTDEVEVMSQNLYIGADLARLLAGESPAAVLQTVRETSFNERAVEIAEAIDDFNPDLIGLQEVSFLRVFDSANNTLEQYDYLQILLDALAATGESYAVASSVDNADVTLPIDLTAGVFGRVLDRDVILYRTRSTTVSDPASANFATNFTASISGFPIEFTRGWTGVDARVHGRSYRFVNTHLEVEGAPCAGATGAVICQEVQAVELQATLVGETLPTILVGDFNAEPGTPAYATFDSGGYLDTWTVRVPYNDEPGFTCCQSERLLNVENELTERIDLVFLSDGDFPRARIVTTVVGDWDQRKTASGLWYSDHGGPFADITTRR
jgi:endonuclease/exonuclease/phosphatase family metal-dependent hydrolase